MNETELERMIVRLVGDGSSYQTMMTNAQNTSSQVAKVIEDNSKKIEAFQKSIQGYAQGAVSALSALGASSFLRNAFSMFGETETATLKLKAAITANGGAVDETLDSYKEFAKELKTLTGLSSDETLGLLKKAEAHGLSGEAAKRASLAAVRMGAGGDVDPESALRITAALEQGEVKRAMQYARMVPALRGVRDETEFLTKATRLMNVGAEQATALMNSSQGMVRQFQGAMKGLTKQFGELVADAVKPFLKQGTELIRMFLDLDKGTKQVIVGAAFLVAGFLSIGPAIAAINGWVMPVLTLMLSGFGLVRTVIMALLSPMMILSMALSTIALIFSPIGLAIAAVSLVVIGLVQHLGGLKPAWEMIRDKALEAWGWVKEKGTEAWEWVKAKALAFMEWIKPALDTLKAIVGLTWEAIKEFGPPAWEAVKNAVVKVWDWVKKVWDITIGWITEFIQQNKEGVLTVLAFSAAVGVLYGVFKLVMFSIAAVNALLTYLHIWQVLGIIAWIAWKAAVLIATIVMAAFNTSIGLGIASLVLLIAVIALVAAAGVAAWTALTSMFTVLLEMPTSSGPLKAIGDIFSEWIGIIKDVIRAAKTDMPLAWQILKAGFTLAVLQVQALWPPLWAFLSEGFKTAWFIVSRVFEETMQGLVEKAEFQGMRIHSALYSLGRSAHKKKLQEIQELEDATNRSNEITINGILRQGRERLRAAQVTFDLARKGGDSEAIRAAREEVERLRALIPEAEAKAAAALAPEKPKLDEIASAYNNAAKEAHKFDAALTGSAEAQSRITAYMDRLGEGLKRNQALDAANNARQEAERTAAAGAAAEAEWSWVGEMASEMERAAEAARRIEVAGWHHDREEEAALIARRERETINAEKAVKRNQRLVEEAIARDPNDEEWIAAASNELIRAERRLERARSREDDAYVRMLENLFPPEERETASRTARDADSTASRFEQEIMEMVEEFRRAIEATPPEPVEATPPEPVEAVTTPDLTEFWSQVERWQEEEAEAAREAADRASSRREWEALKAAEAEAVRMTRETMPGIDINDPPPELQGAVDDVMDFYFRAAERAAERASPPESMTMGWWSEEEMPTIVFPEIPQLTLEVPEISQLTLEVPEIPDVETIGTPTPEPSEPVARFSSTEEEDEDSSDEDTAIFRQMAEYLQEIANREATELVVGDSD